MLPTIFGENLFDDFFDDAFDKHFFNMKNPLYGKHAKNLMKTDVQEGQDDYKLSIDLPGFQKDQIQVDVADGYLTVSATKGREATDEDKERHFIRQERCAGTCTRSFYVGAVRPEEVKCKYESGVLHVTIPKKDAQIEAPQSRILIE